MKYSIGYLVLNFLIQIGVYGDYFFKKFIELVITILYIIRIFPKLSKHPTEILKYSQVCDTRDEIIMIENPFIFHRNYKFGEK